MRFSFFLSIELNFSASMSTSTVSIRWITGDGELVASEQVSVERIVVLCDKAGDIVLYVSSKVLDDEGLSRAEPRKLEAWRRA